MALLEYQGYPLSSKIMQSHWMIHWCNYLRKLSWFSYLSNSLVVVFWKACSTLGYRSCCRVAVLSLQTLWHYCPERPLCTHIITVTFWKELCFSLKALRPWFASRFREISWELFFLPWRQMTTKSSIGCPILGLPSLWWTVLDVIFPLIL